MSSKNIPNVQHTNTDYITTQAIFMNTQYEATDVQVLYSVLTEKEKLILDMEYQRLKSLKRTDPEMFNALAKSTGILIDISSRTKRLEARGKEKLIEMMEEMEDDLSY